MLYKEEALKQTVEGCKKSNTNNMANDHVKQKNEINTCQNHSKPSIL
jgi:hypothetical protein